MVTGNDKETTIATVRKHAFAEVRLVLNTYEGERLVHVREFRKEKGTDTWRPTSKGVAVKLELAGELCKAFRELEAVLETDDDLPF